MKRWILKSAIQRVISWLPASHRINEWFQTHVTHGMDLSAASFEGKLTFCRAHFDYYHRFASPFRDTFTVLELGTGVFPILPIGLYLCGAREVHSFDIVSMVRLSTLQKTLEHFLQCHDSGRLVHCLPEYRKDRIDRLKTLARSAQSTSASPASLLKELNIHVRIRDARHSLLPDDSIDLVYSNLVFEHVPWSVLQGLHREFKRVLVPGGVMNHYIGLEDQFSSIDRSITPFNFLRYTSSQWRWLNSPIVSQTRLRLPDHRRVIEEAGFHIVHQDVVPGSLEDLRSITRAPEFQHYSEDDLLPRFAWIIAKLRQ